MANTETFDELFHILQKYQVQKWIVSTAERPLFMEYWNDKFIFLVVWKLTSPSKYVVEISKFKPSVVSLLYEVRRLFEECSKQLLNQWKLSCTRL